MKSKILITTSVLILILLSVFALNAVSLANYEFLNLKHKRVISIDVKDQVIDFQIADKVFVIKNIFNQK